MARRSEAGAGFTLVEVLVALAIVSIALLATLRVSAMGANSAADLRSRMLGGWVAENLLAEHRALDEWLPLGTRRGHARQAGFEFTWREDVSATAHPAFRRVDVHVFAGTGEQRAVARLTGFVVKTDAP